MDLPDYEALFDDYGRPLPDLFAEERDQKKKADLERQMESQKYPQTWKRLLTAFFHFIYLALAMELSLWHISLRSYERWTASSFLRGILEFEWETIVRQHATYKWMDIILYPSLGGVAIYFSISALNTQDLFFNEQNFKKYLDVINDNRRRYYWVLYIPWLICYTIHLMTSAAEIYFTFYVDYDWSTLPPATVATITIVYYGLQLFFIVDVICMVRKGWETRCFYIKMDENINQWLEMNAQLFHPDQWPDFFNENNAEAVYGPAADDAQGDHPAEDTDDGSSSEAPTEHRFTCRGSTTGSSAGSARPPNFAERADSPGVEDFSDNDVDVDGDASGGSDNSANTSNARASSIHTCTPRAGILQNGSTTASSHTNGTAQADSGSDTDIGEGNGHSGAATEATDSTVGAPSDAESASEVGGGSGRPSVFGDISDEGSSNAGYRNFLNRADTSDDDYEDY